MPTDVQAALMASIPGLNDAEMIRPGYAIEYDAIDPRQLSHSLEVKSIPGLFLAGQINGTSGYEEAACQGLVAGMNAACRVGGIDPLIVGRMEGYTGILISDLVTKGADEPYRMFTSRAEFRLHLRIDNADERLTPLGRRMGLVDSERWSLYERKQRQKDRLLTLMESVRMDPRIFGHLDLPSEERPTISAWLRRTEASIGGLSEWVGLQLEDAPVHGVLQTVETELKYSGYIAQQRRQIDRLRDAEGRHIPGDFSYSDIPGLSVEVQEKLRKVRPETLGQAGRIPGVTPAAVAVLDVYLSLER